MTNYSRCPEDGKYRGVEIPGMVKLHWDNKPGRWWKKGVDDTLGPVEEVIEEQPVLEFGVFE